MLYFIIVLIIVLGFIITFLFSKITVVLEYKKYPGEKLYSKLRLTLFGFSLDKLIKERAKPKKEETDSKEKVSLAKKLEAYTRTIKTVSKIYSSSRYHIQRSLCVETLDFHIKFGVGDAAATGILTGAIWTLLYSLTALVSCVGTLRDHYFEVVPVYTEAGLITEGRAKFSIRIINAIFLAVKLYLTYKKQ